MTENFTLFEHENKESFEERKKKFLEALHRLDTPLPKNYGQIMPEYAYFTRQLFKEQENDVASHQKATIHKCK